jgi:hypothetical protein
MTVCDLLASPVMRPSRPILSQTPWWRKQGNGPTAVVPADFAAGTGLGGRPVATRLRQLAELGLTYHVP